MLKTKKKKKRTSKCASPALDALFARRASLQPPLAAAAAEKEEGAAAEQCSQLRESLSGAEAMMAYSSGEYVYRLDSACAARPDDMRIRIEEEVGSLTGCRIWDTCVLMAKYFEAQYGDGGPLEGGLVGKRILELGAGAGLLGCVLSALGARVTVTEQPPLMALLRRNIESNGFGAVCDARELTWGSTDLTSFCKTPYDMIVGSDILLHARLAPQLFGVLSDLMVRRETVNS